MLKYTLLFCAFILVLANLFFFGSHRTVGPTQDQATFTAEAAIALVLDRLDQKMWSPSEIQSCADFHLRYSGAPFEAAQSTAPGAWIVKHLVKASDTPWLYQWNVYGPSTVAPSGKPKAAPC